MNLTISPTTESVTCSDKLVLTYSALNTFRNCPRKYKHRYLDNLRPRERAEALSFGGIVHSAIELWYRSVQDPNRLESVLNHLDQQFPDRNGDDLQRSLWHLVRAMFTGYAHRYATEDFQIVEVEKEFVGEIRNPDTGRQSQTFRIAGKVDGIVQCHDGMYLLEHKTAASIGRLFAGNSCWQTSNR